LLRLEDLDVVARGERHDRALLVGALAGHVALPLGLALAHHRVDREHVDVPDLLDRLLDLGLVRVRADQERVPVAFQARVRLLAHHRADDHVARRLHSASPSSEPASPASSSELAGVAPFPSRTSKAEFVNRTRSAARRSYTLR